MEGIRLSWNGSLHPKGKLVGVATGSLGRGVPIMNLKTDIDIQLMCSDLIGPKPGSKADNVPYELPANLSKAKGP